MKLSKFFIGILVSSSVLLGVQDVTSANYDTKKNVNIDLLEKKVELVLFKDINNNKLDYLFSKNIVKGYNGANFKPYENLTRSQMAIMVSRSLGAHDKGTYKDSGLLDLSKSSKWSVDYLFDLNIISGNDKNLFSPNDKALFKHIAKVLYKAYYISDKKSNLDNASYEEFINNKFNTNYKSNDKISRVEFSELLHDILNDLDFYGDVKADKIKIEKLEKEKLLAEQLEKERFEAEKLEKEKLKIEKLKIDYDFKSYFEKVEWIDRGGIISLSIYPVSNSPLIVHDENYKLHKNNSFEILKDLYSNDKKWMNNTNSLFEQYSCHVDFASSKVSWNIEPARPFMTGFDMILSKCNPAIPVGN